MLTATQKRTAEAIVNIFETSEVLGRYGQVTLIAGDPGHLTYGRSQTTLASGNLHLLLDRYCANMGALFGARLAPFLPGLAAIDLTLDHDELLKNLLRAAADDPVMRDVQDAFFDEVYWRRAARAADAAGIVSPLGVAVVYDSIVHGSWALIRQRTDTQGTVDAIGERQWIQNYATTRRQWLANHVRQVLHATVYRMDAFQRLIDQNLWALPLPLVVRGKEISATSLAGQPTGCYDGPLPGSRPLMLQTPLLRGLDVRRVQLGLATAGHDVLADGMWGPASTNVLKAYQQANNLPATGVADLLLVLQLAAI